MNGVTAADSTGCVQIELDSSGRVDGLRLSARWRDKLGDERLSGALTEAVLLASAESPEPGAAPPAMDTTALTSDQVAEQCRTALTAAAHQMERDRSASRCGYTGSDARHHVTVTMTLDGIPTAVELDPRWLETVSTDRLVETVQEALGAAYDAAETARREVAGSSEGGTR
jgi:DNA-binding protein YbaB